MQGAKQIFFTIDCWTSGNTRSILGLTAHFIGDDAELKSILQLLFLKLFKLRSRLLCLYKSLTTYALWKNYDLRSGYSIVK
jgi:hypothetical protein